MDVGLFKNSRTPSKTMSETPFRRPSTAVKETMDRFNMSQDLTAMMQMKREENKSSIRTSRKEFVYNDVCTLFWSVLNTTFLNLKTGVKEHQKSYIAKKTLPFQYCCRNATNVARPPFLAAQWRPQTTTKWPCPVVCTKWTYFAPPDVLFKRSYRIISSGTDVIIFAVGGLELFRSLILTRESFFARFSVRCLSSIQKICSLRALRWFSVSVRCDASLHFPLALPESGGRTPASPVYYPAFSTPWLCCVASPTSPLLWGLSTHNSPVLLTSFVKFMKRSATSQTSVSTKSIPRL